ncbi:hypothetical protein Golax_004675 [Gossypium laxum]|uniref:Uncharacterized protein n=1 Tax=Gossypium laxum TaxID=34288 RepID=A0A7J9AZZ7_9ROSI|nr:hypothetical protein [Gossypium laxum]
MTLLRCSRIQVDRIYSKAVNVPTFLRKLMNITGMRPHSSAPRCEEKGRYLCFKYIWFGCFP